MAIVGRLEEVSLGQILEYLGMSEKTGRLTVTTGTDECLVVLRSGRIIYATSSSVHETFGSIVTGLGLVTETQLAEALRLQHQSAEERRLGAILQEMGALTAADARTAMMQQFRTVLAEVLAWKRGFFRFRLLRIPDHGEVEVDARDLLADWPVDPRQVILDTARMGDEASRDEPRPPRSEKARRPEKAPNVSVGSMVRSAPGTAITAEAVAAVFGAASPHVRRGMLLAVRPAGIAGLAQFGLTSEGGRPNARVRSLRLPLTEPSILSRALADEAARCESVESNRGNRALAESLGGPWPRQALVVPLRTDDAVRLLFYGDNEPEGDDIAAPAELAARLQQALADAVVAHA